MDIALFISRFLYRIRYKLLIGSLIVTALVAYFTQYLPRTYTVKTTIYTGLVSESEMITGNSSWRSVGTTFDNIFTLLKAQNTLENVSLRLLAMNLIYGDPDSDNTYITAENYQSLVAQVPAEIRNLVDRNSVETTVERLRSAYQPSSGNFLYGLLNSNAPFYSYTALQEVEVSRLQNSDMVELSYTCSDPGITTNTVKLFNEELLASYNELRYNSTNDVIDYYESEVARIRQQLTEQEDGLAQYNEGNNIINYGEQTSSLAKSYNNFRSLYEQALLSLQRSISTMEEMERRMSDAERMLLTNSSLLESLNHLSRANTRMIEAEMPSGSSGMSAQQIAQYRQQLAQTEQRVLALSDSLGAMRSTKEGLSMGEYAEQWLEALIEKTKAESELDVLDMRRSEYEEEYRQLSPIGTEIERRQRDIRFTEKTYNDLLQSLNQAYAQKSKLQLSTANLYTVNKPMFPLTPNKSMRFILVIGAFVGSIIFIIIYQIMVEMLDQTLRDGERTKRLTGIAPVGALVGNGSPRSHQQVDAWNRLAAANICSKLNRYLKPRQVNYVNVVAIDSKEGKSYVASYLENEWKRIGLNVLLINIEPEFTETPNYVLSEDFSSIIDPADASRYNVVIVEYPALIINSLPPMLAQSATLNLLVANAKHSWKKSDTDALANFNEEVGEATLKLILNNASRFDVEDYTGELPHSSKARNDDGAAAADDDE